ncbi:MAG TPA: CoA transferase [Thermoanaerobaculia bacterium]|nr:CoA transferase [Thermoanaerobaculia bacterium]
MKARLPLTGITVADFSRVLAGPLCTQILGDAGARVIKIEEPGGGDETRRWGPPFVNGVSAYFLSVNRNKESVALDLKSPSGRKIARQLIRRADVVVDNFLPRQRKEFGLGRRANPRAIHLSIGGYDSDTPDADAPGYDVLAQAASGLMAITGPREGEPAKAGVALADVLTGHYAVAAILAALYAREKTGRGESIEVSLFGAAVASLINVAQAALVTGNEARRHGNEHPSIVPYQLFHASDRPFVIGAGTDRHFASLCRDVLKSPTLATDERFATNSARVQNRAVLVPILQSALSSRKAAQWVERCRKANVPAALVQGVREALQTPAGERLLVDIEHPLAGEIAVVGNPLRFSGRRFPVRRPPPLLGEHTEAVLRELGIR